MGGEKSYANGASIQYELPEEFAQTFGSAFPQPPFLDLQVKKCARGDQCPLRWRLLCACLDSLPRLSAWVDAVVMVRGVPDMARLAVCRLFSTSWSKGAASLLGSDPSSVSLTLEGSCLAP